MVIGGGEAATGVCSGSPHAHLIYDGHRPSVVTASCSNVHAIVFSSKRDQQNPTATACDCARTDDDDNDATLRAAQSSQSADDDVQYYVVGRRKLATAVRLTTAKRTPPVTDDVKQLRLRGTRAESGDNPAVKSLVGECRPLLVVTPGECCKNQRYSPVPASVDNSNDSANS